MLEELWQWIPIFAGAFVFFGRELWGDALQETAKGQTLRCPWCGDPNKAQSDLCKTCEVKVGR